MSRLEDTLSVSPARESDQDRNRDEETFGENTSLSTNSVSRRSFLAALGVSAGATSIASMNVQAVETGYGAGGYGNGSYGGDSDEDASTLSVTTKPATAVTDTAVTLNAELTGLGGADAVNAYFEISRAGASTWFMTGREQLTASTAFSATLDGFASDTAYEYRAVAESNDARATGDIVAFSTETATHEIDPVIETFEVTNTSSTDSHAEFTVDWAVSHVANALDTVRITVYDEYGLPIAGPEIHVSGADAADTDVLTVPYGAGSEYLVTLVVTDTYGNVTIDRELVIAASA